MYIHVVFFEEYITLTMGEAFEAFFLFEKWLKPFMPWILFSPMTVVESCRLSFWLRPQLESANYEMLHPTILLSHFDERIKGQQRNTPEEHQTLRSSHCNLGMIEGDCSDCIQIDVEISAMRTLP